MAGLECAVIRIRYLPLLPLSLKEGLWGRGFFCLGAQGQGFSLCDEEAQGRGFSLCEGAQGQGFSLSERVQGWGFSLWVCSEGGHG